ncbi:MAG: LytTR family DNA-binding domain-containing protein [Asticcacaulis sp.]
MNEYEVNLTQTHLRFAASVMVCVVFMIAVGPFGQAERFLLSHRVGLWVMYVLIGLPVLWGIHGILGKVWRGQRWTLAAGRVILSACLASVPVLGIVEAIGLLEGRPLPTSTEAYIGSIAEVAVLAVPFTFLLEQYRQARRSVSASDASDVTDIVSEFGEICAICAEGHYTRVYTVSGDRFVDRSFSDMLRRVTPLEGMQVHRSWWVARTAVEGAQRKGSSLSLTIRGGVTVPVARRRLAHLRKAGWPMQK